MNEPAVKEALWTREFFGMSLVSFLIYLTQYAMIAALPIVMMQEYGGGDVEAGLAMTFFQIGTVAARPCAGILIDAVNKRRLMIVISVLFFIVMALFLVASAISMLYGLRLLHGVIFAVATTTAAALAALILPPSRKGEGIGYFALSTNLAMVVGPMVGLLIMEHLSSTALFAALSVLAALSIVMSTMRLPAAVILPQGARRRLSVQTFIERRALAPALIAGILFFAYGSVLTFIPLYTRSLGLSAETSLFYACYAGAILVTRPFVGRIFDRMGPDYTVYPGVLLFAVGMALLGSITGLTGLVGEPCSSARGSARSRLRCRRSPCAVSPHRVPVSLRRPTSGRSTSASGLLPQGSASSPSRMAMRSPTASWMWSSSSSPHSATPSGVAWGKRNKDTSKRLLYEEIIRTAAACYIPLSFFCSSSASRAFFSAFLRSL